MLQCGGPAKYLFLVVTHVANVHPFLNIKLIPHTPLRLTVVHINLRLKFIHIQSVYGPHVTAVRFVSSQDRECVCCYTISDVTRFLLRYLKVAADGRKEGRKEGRPVEQPIQLLSVCYICFQDSDLISWRFQRKPHKSPWQLSGASTFPIVLNYLYEASISTCLLGSNIPCKNNAWFPFCPPLRAVGSVCGCFQYHFLWKFPSRPVFVELTMLQRANGSLD